MVFEKRSSSDQKIPGGSLMELDLGFDDDDDDEDPTTLSRLRKVETDVKALVLARDRDGEEKKNESSSSSPLGNLDEVIKFGRLGLTSFDDAKKWLQSNAPKPIIGLFIDPHSLLHHIQKERERGCVDKNEFFDRLMKVQDSGFRNEHELETVCSYHRLGWEGIPKFFIAPRSKSSDNEECVWRTEKELDESYFTKMPNYETWERKISDLPEQIMNMQMRYGDLIDDCVGTGFEKYSPAYYLARETVYESCSFLRRFINDFKYLYHTLLPKIGSQYSMHVTSRTYAKIWKILYRHDRHRRYDRFCFGNNEQIYQNIFWSVMKTHDLITKRFCPVTVSRLHCEPAVASDLAMYLAINFNSNTSVPMSDMKHKIESLEETIKKMEAEAVQKDKQVSSLESMVETLVKRIDALEKTEHDPNEGEGTSDQ